MEDKAVANNITIPVPVVEAIVLGISAITTMILVTQTNTNTVSKNTGLHRSTGIGILLPLLVTGVLIVYGNVLSNTLTVSRYRTIIGVFLFALAGYPLGVTIKGITMGDEIENTYRISYYIIMILVFIILFVICVSLMFGNATVLQMLYITVTPILVSISMFITAIIASG